MGEFKLVWYAAYRNAKGDGKAASEVVLILVNHAGNNAINA